jgi:pimeloyl-ACP methyl ester carboxylesterase
MTVRIFAILGIVLASLMLVILGMRLAIAKKFSTGGAPSDAIQRTAISMDGTRIAYEQTGRGPLLILVSAALTDRDGDRPLAKQLASRFTVLNYDRRGRGKSTNTERYAVEREIEDLVTLANTSTGPVYLFGSSSGAVLALDAANRLGTKVTKVFLYEPPFIVDNSRPPLSGSLLNEINAALAANDRAKAITLFFNKGMGVPRPGVLLMKLFLPAWENMLKLAHTAPYDLMILSGTQSGNPLPCDRWSHANAPTMVAVGATSEPFFHSGAKALAGVLPSVSYESLDGLDHSAVLMAPQAIATALRQFFAAN